MSKHPDFIALSEEWASARLPEPSYLLSEWADKHRLLATKGSSEAGPWRTSRTPYLREIMDALSIKNPVQRVVFMKGAQVGATEAGLNWIGYVIHHAPGPMMVVTPTVEMAKRFSRQRLEQMLNDTPALRARVPHTRSREAGNTLLLKEFAGGILVMVGSNSPGPLSSMPVRYLFCDEVDRYPLSAEKEGDPLSLLMARTATFSSRRKVFLVSTPTIEGVSKIAAEYALTDQRRYFVPCPHCGHMQFLKWPSLRWEAGRPETAGYVCEDCGALMREHHKTRMFAAGQWRATAVAQGDAIGFHLSSLYSPVGWTAWEELARGWEQSAASVELRQTFVNTKLGETWTDQGEGPDWEKIHAGRAEYRRGTVPAGVLVLTAGADVQKDRIEVSVWGWGRGLTSWLVDHLVITGDPSTAEAWEPVNALLARDWRHERGAPIKIERLAVDSGHETAAVYKWARKAGVRVLVVKGAAGAKAGSAPVSVPSAIDGYRDRKRTLRGVRVYGVNTPILKTELYRWLWLERGAGVPPDGSVFIPHDVDVEWCRQLVAEQLVRWRDRRGYMRTEWRAKRERNEALDCRVYARAATWVLGMDRWSETQWQEREARVAVVPTVKARALPSASAYLAH